MRQKLLNFQPSDIKVVQKDSDAEKARKLAQRKDASQKMTAEMQKLFSQLLWTNQNYVDPTNVLNSVVDDQGNVCQVGEQ